ncbi:trypco2 family protein [Dactylosporangium sp. CA-139066]|uniref:trypco2 family protein n=1 Tax=Dactylosporangium sp. CA-139066 TaxID=3239930 RepID=UPI003D94AC18
MASYEWLLLSELGRGMKVDVDAAERLAQGGLVHGELLLADALESLRGQLREAVDRAQGEDLSFSCESVEVQLQVVVANTRKGEAKAGLWSVVTVGGGIDATTSATHVIKLVLKPELHATGGKLQLSDD